MRFLWPSDYLGSHVMGAGTDLTRIVLLGDSGVGKSTLLARALGKPPNDTTPTVGVDFSVIRNKGAKAYVWDTAGAERFAGITKQYVRAAHGVLCVCDNRASSQKHLSTWLALAQECAPNARVLVVKNKCDLPDEEQAAWSEMTLDGVEKVYHTSAYDERPLEPFLFFFALGAPRALPTVTTVLMPEEARNTCCS